MIAQSLHQLVSTYTGWTNKILGINSQKLGHFRTQPWNFTQWGFLPIEWNICAPFLLLFFAFLTAAWGVLHLSCLLAFILVLLIYFSGCLSYVQFVYCHFICVFISHSGFHFNLYLLVSVELSFLDFLVSLKRLHIADTEIILQFVSSFILNFILSYLYHPLI